jgi:hypothetical protein
MLFSYSIYIKNVSFYLPIFSLADTGTLTQFSLLSVAAAGVSIIYNIANSKLSYFSRPVHETLLDSYLLISDNGNQI